MKKLKLIGLNVISLAVLSACSTTQQPFSPDASYLEHEYKANVEQTAEVVNDGKNPLGQTNRVKLERVESFDYQAQKASISNDVLAQFDDKATITLAADELPLKDYLHQVLGERLKLSYILDDEVKEDTQTVTLNIQEALTARKLFTLTEELLAQRKYAMRFDDNIFYVHKVSNQDSRTDSVYGFGNQVEDVPQTSRQIIQMVPLHFGVKNSLVNTLRTLIGVKSTNDGARNGILIQGKRGDIIRAIELIQLYDQPNFKGREIAIYQSTYVAGNDIIKKLSELFKQEGLTLGPGTGTEKAVNIVELEKQGRLILFSSQQALIDRALYWITQIDKPLQTVDKQYFIYQPKYSRAIDMGESLEALIGDVSSIGATTSAANENTSANSRRGSFSASSKDIKMVVDERSNSIVFFTNGEKYQQLLPLVKRLDVMPKQIALEVMIAEVSLTDEFKAGVEFALNKGNYGLSNRGSFMGEGFGGLSYLLQGDYGELAINLLQTNSLVNVLSRPSLVVRDGISADISVGTDIPIIGETASDPINGDKQTTKVEYRKTGVQLSVKPTVNAQGIVIMEIKQKISNQLESGSTVAGNPAVFERDLSTEVIAQSGQTVILGGLISENRTKKDSKVPLLGDIPIVGNLFRAQTDGGDKTELVVVVTPRVLENQNDWADIKQIFNQQLTELKLD